MLSWINVNATRKAANARRPEHIHRLEPRGIGNLRWSASVVAEAVAEDREQNPSRDDDEHPDRDSAAHGRDLVLVLGVDDRGQGATEMGDARLTAGRPVKTDGRVHLAVRRGRWYRVIPEPPLESSA